MLLIKMLMIDKFNAIIMCCDFEEEWKSCSIESKLKLEY